MVPGSYSSEQGGVARMISERLLQSAGDTMRVLPAGPRDSKQ